MTYYPHNAVIKLTIATDSICSLPLLRAWFKPSLTAGAKFAFDIYDFEGKSRMDLFYLGDCLRNIQTDNQQIEN